MPVAQQWLLERCELLESYWPVAHAVAIGEM